MTELETMQRAKMYLEKLAQGIDPITDQEISEDSTLNNVRLARCFFYVSDVLGQVIANGGVIGGKPKLLPFNVDANHMKGLLKYRAQVGRSTLGPQIKFCISNKVQVMPILLLHESRLCHCSCSSVLSDCDPMLLLLLLLSRFSRVGLCATP